MYIANIAYTFPFVVPDALRSPDLPTSSYSGCLSFETPGGLSNVVNVVLFGTLLDIGRPTCST